MRFEETQCIVLELGARGDCVTERTLVLGREKPSTAILKTQRTTIHDNFMKKRILSSKELLQRQDTRNKDQRGDRRTCTPTAGSDRWRRAVRSIRLEGTSSTSSSEYTTDSLPRWSSGAPHISRPRGENPGNKNTFSQCISGTRYVKPVTSALEYTAVSPPSLSSGAPNMGTPAAKPQEEEKGTFGPKLSNHVHPGNHKPSAHLPNTDAANSCVMSRQVL